METKKCLACGREMALDQDRCPQCYLAGQNQLFLSQKDYEAWERQVLIPFKGHLKPPQVFVGANHALVILPNGDLYSFGKKKTGGFEPPQPMASRVLHAAASPRHTIWVDWDGRVHVQGDSDFARRFSCDVTAKRVYAHYAEESFLIIDRLNQPFFAGENPEGYFMASSREWFMEPVPYRPQASYVAYPKHTDIFQGCWPLDPEEYSFLIPSFFPDRPVKTFLVHHSYNWGSSTVKAFLRKNGAFYYPYSFDIEELPEEDYREDIIDFAVSSGDDRNFVLLVTKDWQVLRGNVEKLKKTRTWKCMEIVRFIED